MKPYTRHDRVSHLIQRELATLIRSELDDEKLTWASIAHVEMGKDLKIAYAYVSHLQRENIDACVDALNQAAGYLRGQLRALKLRHIPELVFKADTVLHEGEQLEQLIRQARARDGSSAT